MKPIPFDGHNVVFAADQPPYYPLPAHRFSKDDPCGGITCCWQLTWRERLKLFVSGKLWHRVLTFNRPLQPQKLDVDRPNWL